MSVNCSSISTKCKLILKFVKKAGDTMDGKFNGDFEHNLDTKNRLFIPVNYRPLIEGKLMVRFSMSDYPHIDCIREEEFEDFVRKEVEESKVELSPDELDSIARAHSRSVSIDNGGRICIPSKLLELTGISKESVFVGKGDYFQIWNPEIHEKFNAHLLECVLEEKAAANAQRIMNNKYKSEGKFLELKNTLSPEQQEQKQSEIPQTQKVRIVLKKKKK